MGVGWGTPFYTTLLCSAFSQEDLSVDKSSQLLNYCDPTFTWADDVDMPACEEIWGLGLISVDVINREHEWEGWLGSSESF